jgi:hypothetical protein
MTGNEKRDRIFLSLPLLCAIMPTLCVYCTVSTHISIRRIDRLIDAADKQQHLSLLLPIPGRDDYQEIDTHTQLTTQSGYQWRSGILSVAK